MKKILLIGAAALLLAGCNVDIRDARATLEAQGLTGIRLTGYAMFGCGERDYYRTKFVATGVNGKTVTGVLCAGLFKGITVRYDSRPF